MGKIARSMVALEIEEDRVRSLVRRAEMETRTARSRLLTQCSAQRFSVKTLKFVARGIGDALKVTGQAFVAAEGSDLPEVADALSQILADLKTCSQKLRALRGSMDSRLKQRAAEELQDATNPTRELQAVA